MISNERLFLVFFLIIFFVLINRSLYLSKIKLKFFIIINILILIQIFTHVYLTINSLKCNPTNTTSIFNLNCNILALLLGFSYLCIIIYVSTKHSISLSLIISLLIVIYMIVSHIITIHPLTIITKFKL